MKELAKRLEKLREELTKSKLEAFLVTKPINVRYLSNFRGSDSYLLISQKHSLLLTDFCYRGEAAQEIKNFEICQREKAQGLFDLVKTLVERKKIKHLGFEGNNLSCLDFQKLAKKLKNLNLKPTQGLVEKLRLIKSRAEIELLKKSINIGEKVLAALLAKVKPGIKEKDLLLEAEYLLRKLGAEGSSFPIIIASGKRTAFPHARTGSTPIHNNAILMFDLGVNYLGYLSDLTRTFFLGRMTRKFAELYKIVKEAQLKAIKNVRVGQRISELDLVARQHFKKAGLEKYFGHGLGHGVGLEIHEGPTIFYTNTDTLKENMVFTVEPAIYIAGWGGIRIEDMVRVTKAGCEILSKFPKDSPQI